MLEVWYSDDQRRVPVRISSKVIVGGFTATLVKAFRPYFKADRLGEIIL